MTCKSNRRGAWRAAALLGAVALAVVPQAARAWATYDQLVGAQDFTGSRSTAVGAGLTAYNAYAKDNTRAGWPDPAFQVRWVITQKADGTYHYTYTFTGDAFQYQNGQFRTTNNTNRIDHMVLDVGDDCAGTGGKPKPECVKTATAKASALGSKKTVSVSYGDMDGITGGVRFGTASGIGYDGTIYEFDSARAPVWGHLAVSGSSSNGCAKVGSANVACTGALVAFINGQAGWGDLAKTYFIPVVDAPATNGVPEPGTLLLMGAGLAGFGGLQRRRRRTP